MLWAFRSEGVHPAWIDTNTLPIVAFTVFLEFAEGDLYKIEPCEIELPERYPALGLELRATTREAFQYRYQGGELVDAVSVEEALAVLPFVIEILEESDPMGEDVSTQYCLVGNDAQSIVIRHIKPPMTLGLEVKCSAGAPNN